MLKKRLKKNPRERKRRNNSLYIRKTFQIEDKNGIFSKFV